MAEPTQFGGHGLGALGVADTLVPGALVDERLDVCLVLLIGQ